MCRAGRRAEWSTGLTGLCSLWGRQECLPYLRQECLPYLPVVSWFRACPERSRRKLLRHGAQGYRPVLSTGQARMPTLPKAGVPTLPECRFGMFGSFGRFGFLGSFGILGRILLPPEFAARDNRAGGRLGGSRPPSLAPSGADAARPFPSTAGAGG